MTLPVSIVPFHDYRESVAPNRKALLGMGWQDAARAGVAHAVMDGVEAEKTR